MDVYYPSVQEVVHRRKLKGALLWGYMLLLLVITFGVIGFVSYYAPKVPGYALIALGIAMFVVFSVPGIIWNRPRMGMMILFGAAMIFEADPRVARSGMLRTVPFFLNMNTWGELYSVGALSPLKISPAEILIFLSAFFYTIQTIAVRKFKFDGGIMFWPIVFYSVMVLWGFVRGMTSGGDFLMALWEMRSQSLFIFAYFLASNMLQEEKEVKTLLWLMLAGFGIRSFMGVANYLIVGGVITDQGILQHEDSLLFNLIFVIMLFTALVKVDDKMKVVATLLFPTVLFSILENKRRAGIAAFIVALIPFFAMTWFVAGKNKALVAKIGLAIIVLTSIYLPLAWNSDSAWALPARSIKSQFSPDPRDKMSNAYREAEDFDLKATRDSSPILGFGFGKKYMQPVPLAKVSTEFLYYMPHNSILWVWMRLGHIGFFAFLILIVSGIVLPIQMLKRTKHPYLQMLCVLTSMYTIMIFMFGKLDLAIHNYRSITILGLMYGSMSLVAKTIKQDEENKPELIEPEAGHLQSDTEFVRNIQDMGFGRAESARR